MDAQDLRLIGLLRENARMSVARLAKQLGVSRGTVQNRIDRLIADNVLLGFTVRTTPEAAAHRVRAIMSIAVEGDRIEGDRSDAIMRTLRGRSTPPTGGGIWWPKSVPRACRSSTRYCDAFARSKGSPIRKRAFC